MANRVSTVESDDDDGDALFVKDGAPVKFCFHKSVTQGRGQITRDVERHGGQIVVNERYADVLVVDEQLDLAFFRRRYYSSTELYRHSLYIEPRGFVRACIRSGTYQHGGPVRQRMPGRARVPGRGVRRVRVEFTEEDRDHLAYYLATRCPTRDGRMGNSAYKDLERLGQTADRSWEWARRHTFHSWREHYKMNPEMMDVRINHYLQQLRGVGHHLGHDPRSRDELRRQREEEEEEEEEEEQEERVEQQDRQRRQEVRPAPQHLARHEQDLTTSDEEEESDGIQQEEEEAIQELQRVKRHRVQPDAHRQDDSRDTQSKRARVSEASSSKRQAPNVEADRDESSPEREEDNNAEESQEIEGSDLFGDREYGSYSNFDDNQDFEFLMPFSSKAGPVPEQDNPPPPLSTQETLVSSPRFTEKEPSPAPVPSTNAVKAPAEQVPTFESTGSPSSQQTLVITQERVAVQRARVRGASAQPGPSISMETRTRGGAAASDAPYRNTRARSRSVEPQSQPEPEAKLPRQQEDQGNKGKGKAKEKVLVPIEEDIHVEEEQSEEYEEEDAIPVSVSNGLSVQDAMSVEAMLEDGESQEDEHDEEDGDSDRDVMSGLPRFQEIEIEGEPSDSDDAETHKSLVRDVVQEGGESGSDQSQDQDEDEDENEDNAARVERMASETLLNHAALTPAPLQPRATRSMTASQQHSQTGPRRTRSGNQAHAVPTNFPSPGTKARAVVDRFQQERKKPYAPPPGSRAAKAVKGRG